MMHTQQNRNKANGNLIADDYMHRLPTNIMQLQPNLQFQTSNMKSIQTEMIGNQNVGNKAFEIRKAKVKKVRNSIDQNLVIVPTMREILMACHKVILHSYMYGRCLTALIEDPVWCSSQPSALDVLVIDSIDSLSTHSINKVIRKSNIIPAALSNYQLSGGYSRSMNSCGNVINTNLNEFLGLTSPTEICFIPLTSFIQFSITPSTVVTECPCFICLPTETDHKYSHDVTTLYLHLLRSRQSPSDMPENLPNLMTKPNNLRDFFASSGHMDLYHVSPLSDVEFRATDITEICKRIKDRIHHQGDNNRFKDHVNSDDETNRSLLSSEESLSDEGKHRIGSIEKDSGDELKDERRMKRILNRVLSEVGDLSDAIWILERGKRKVTTSGGCLNEGVDSELVEMRVPQYRLRNLRGEYLTIIEEKVGDYTELIRPKDEREKLKTNIHPSIHCRRQQQSTLELEQLRSLQIGLRLNSTSNPTRESSFWYITYSIRPSVPIWTDHRPLLLQSPYAGLEFSQSQIMLKSNERLKSNLTFLPPTLPLHIQELLLIEDLLFCFIGISGQFIKFKYCADEIQKIDNDQIHIPLSLASIQDQNPVESIRKFKVTEILKSSPDDSIFMYFEFDKMIDDRIPIDSSLLQMVEKILSVCRIFRKLIQFVEVHWNFKYGFCSQAICESMKDLLKEFQIRISQLESQHQIGKVSLQRFWYYLQPTLTSFSILEQIVDNICYRRGGQLLNGLFNVSIMTSNRSENAQRLCQFLLDKACLPLTSILSRWIYEGVIDDPHEEFFISDNRSITLHSPEITSAMIRADPNSPASIGSIKWYNQVKSINNLKNDENQKHGFPNDDSIMDCGSPSHKLGPFGGHPLWFRKFQLIPDFVPHFLKTVATEALNAGKHLSVISSIYSQENKGRVLCGSAVEDRLNDDECREGNQAAMSLRRGTIEVTSCSSPLEQNYCLSIRHASIDASRQLMQYLLNVCDLRGRLFSLRRFILCAQSDFLVNLITLIEDEVKVHPVMKTATRLNYLLHNAIDNSSLAADHYRSEIRCTLSFFLVREVSIWFKEGVADENCHSTLMNLDVTNTMIAEAAGLEPHDSMGVQDFSRVDKQHPLLNDSTFNVTSATYHDRSSSFAAHASMTSSSIKDSPAAAAQKSLSGRFQELLKYLTLVFEFDWPLSLIFNRVSIVKYQLLFRLILQLKDTEKKLNQLWQMQMRTRTCQSDTSESRSNLHNAIAIRLRMIHFVRNFTLYVTIEVLELRFNDFYAKLKEASTLDGVMELHNQFLDVCLSETLLTDPVIIRSISKILTVCHLYTSSLSRFSLYRLERTAIVLESKDDLTRPGYPGCPSSEETYGIIVKQFMSHFDKNLTSFLRLLVEKSRGDPKHSTHIHNLLTRLDFNGYYSKALDTSITQHRF